MKSLDNFLDSRDGSVDTTQLEVGTLPIYVAPSSNDHQEFFDAMEPVVNQVAAQVISEIEVVDFSLSIFSKRPSISAPLFTEIRRNNSL